MTAMTPAEMPDGAVCAAGKNVRIRLHVHPGGKCNGVTGVFGDALKIELQAPPVEGRANAALLKIFAKWLTVPKSAVALVSGESSRDKILEISGLSPQQIKEKLSMVK